MLSFNIHIEYRLHSAYDIETCIVPYFFTGKVPLDTLLDTIVNDLLLYILFTNLCVFYLLVTSFCMFLYAYIYACWLMNVYMMPILMLKNLTLISVGGSFYDDNWRWQQMSANCTSHCEFSDFWEIWSLPEAGFRTHSL